MFNLLCKLYAALKRGHQVVTQAATDVIVMEMFFNQRLVLQALSDSYKHKQSGIVFFN